MHACVKFEVACLRLKRLLKVEDLKHSEFLMHLKPPYEDGKPQLPVDWGEVRRENVVAPQQKAS